MLAENIACFVAMLDENVACSVAVLDEDVACSVAVLFSTKPPSSHACEAAMKMKVGCLCAELDWGDLLDARADTCGCIVTRQMRVRDVGGREEWGVEWRITVSSHNFARMRVQRQANTHVSLLRVLCSISCERRN